MDISTFEIRLLSECGLYTYNNSIALSADTARVVTMNQLKNHLKLNYPDEYTTVTNASGSLERFLKGQGREYVRSERTRPWPKWNFELITMDKYKLDKRHEHNCFSELTNIDPDSSPLLFVFYNKDDKRRFEAERSKIKKQQIIEAFEFFRQPLVDPVSEEIQTFYEKLTPSEQFYNKAKSIIARIQKMVDGVWPGMNYKVTNFGSTANRLCFGDADVDLCILVPRAQYEQDLKLYKNRLSRRPKSVYNMFFLANRLKELHMTNVETIGNASVPICKFLDPQTGLHCDINTNNVLGIENTQLLGIYADLDTRIRPFITAIKYFVKQKEINNAVGGTLSSYAYVLMALHYLISVVHTPVIPSLQDLNVNCQSRSCHSRSNKLTLVYFNHKLMHCDTRYHDCVQVQNVATQEYMTEPNKFKNHSYSIWKSQNSDSLSELLCGFFEYFSDTNNHSVSIINQQGNLVDYNASYWNDYMIIQDPFLLSKNIARTCTSIGAQMIVKEFQRAANLLRSKTPFATICDKQYNFPKSLDTESIDYRLNQQKLQKLLQHTNEDMVDEVFLSVIREAAQQQKEQDAIQKKLEQREAEQDAKKKIEEQKKQQEQQKKQQEQSEDEFAREQLKSELKKELQKDLLSPSNSRPIDSKQSKAGIHQMIDQMMDGKPASTIVGLEPYTDMDKLVEGFAKSGISKDDVSYLCVQFEHIHNALKEQSRREETSDEEMENIEKLLSFFMQEEKDTATSSKSASPTKLDGTKQMISESLVPKDPELISDMWTVDDYQVKQDNVSNKVEELMGLHQQRLDLSASLPSEDDDDSHDDDDIVDIECYVKDVPIELDNYEIYTQLAWRGRVLGITPYKQKINLMTWLVHMQVFYGSLGAHFPKAIQLGISDDDYYDVSAPVIV